jgi:hypothetical protein
MAETRAGVLRRRGLGETAKAGRVEPGPALAGRAQPCKETATLDLTRQPRKLRNSKRQPREATMSAHFVVELEITNPAAMEP